MKKLLFLALAALSTMSANAQFNYTFSKSTATYVPLTSGTNINGNIVWDEEYFKVPIGFTFDMNGITIDSASIIGGNMVATDTVGVVSVFTPTTSDLMDKNYDTGAVVSMSPIRYELTGTTPNRIFKVEVANAAFFDEYDAFGTTDDSLSYQVWLYEGSDIVEIHYGPSNINHPDLYYYNDSQVVNMGYIKNVDFNVFSLDMFYFLKGDPANPSVDSTNNVMASLNEGLESMPASGTVYRFTPPTLSVKNAMAVLKQVSAYPTAAQQELFIENGSNDVVNYTIISMNGTAISNGKASSGKTKVDVSDLPAGNYLIQLSNGEIAKAVKFIKL